MTHPRSAFGAPRQWPGKAGSTASAGLHGLTLDRRGLTGMSTGISTDMRTDWRLGELIC